MKTDEPAPGTTDVAGSGRVPIDVEFGGRSLSGASRVAVSSDGSMVAYVVDTPPEKPPEGAPRYLPNGVPASVVGSRVHLTDVATGKSEPIGPEGAWSWRPWWSPDGSRFAFYCDEGGFAQLWVHDVADGKSARVSEARIKSKLWVGDEPYWSADGTQIYVPLAPREDEAASASEGPDAGAVSVKVFRSGSEAAEQGGGAVVDLDAFILQESRCVLAAVGVADGAVRVIVEADASPPPSVLQLSPSADWISYLSVFRQADKQAGAAPKVQTDLVVVPAAGGDPTVVAGGLAVSEGSYHLNAYVWHPDADQLLWIDDGQLWTAEIGAVGKPRRLAGDLGEITFAPLAVTADGEAVVVGADPLDLHDYRDPVPQALAVVPLDGSDPIKVAVPEGILFRSLVRERGSATWQPQPGMLTILGYDQTTAEQLLLRIDPAAASVTTLWRGLAKLDPVGGIADGRLLAAYEDLGTPGDLYAFDAGGMRGERITTVEPRLEGIQFGPAETFRTRVPQHDGTFTTATTAVLLPPGAKRGDRLPALMFFYPGGRVAGNVATFGGGMPSTVPVSAFTTRGYAVLLAEAPLSPMGPDGGNPMAELVDVLVPQVNRAAELGYVDLERVAIAGQSYGGYGTAATISGTNLFRAAIAINGLYDLPGQYGWLNFERGTDFFFWAESGQGRMGTHPWAALQRYIANSPYYRADRIHTPLLLVHGSADDTCPVGEAGKLFNALKRLGRTVQLAVYEGEGHVPFMWSRANAVDAVERMLDFLDRHLIS